MDSSILEVETSLETEEFEDDGNSSLSVVLMLVLPGDAGVMTVLTPRFGDGEDRLSMTLTVSVLLGRLCSIDSNEGSTIALVAETVLAIATTGSEVPKKFGMAT